MQTISKPPVSVEELWEMNSCGYTREAWVEMHRRKGYTLDNVPPRDFYTAELGACLPVVASFASKIRASSPSGLLLSGKAAYSSDWVLQLVFSVVDGRLRQGRTTIVTTQYDSAELLRKLTVNGDSATAEAILSRFRTYEKARLDGKDRRAA